MNPTLTRKDPRVTFNLILVFLTWIIYLIGTGILALGTPGGAAAAILLPGGFLFTWLAYYRHELWHNYFPGISNPLAYRIVSCVLFSDPQVYGLCHASHHKHVHTERDLEFFCEDHATDRPRRRKQFLRELLVGNMAWELHTVLRLKRQGKLNVLRARISLLLRVCFVTTLGLVADHFHPGACGSTIAVFFLTAWWGAVLTRHNQWVEHLGLLDNSAGFEDRNLMTRALPTTGWGSRLFNFMNHNDALDHVLHHLHPELNTRDMGLILPGEAPTISLADYRRLLAHHWETL